MFLLKAKSKPSTTPRKRKRHDVLLPKVIPAQVKDLKKKAELEQVDKKKKKIVAEILGNTAQNEEMKDHS